MQTRIGYPGRLALILLVLFSLSLHVLARPAESLRPCTDGEALVQANSPTAARTFISEKGHSQQRGIFPDAIIPRPEDLSNPPLPNRQGAEPSWNSPPLASRLVYTQVTSAYL
jgi:hypothetical protein